MSLMPMCPAPIPSLAIVANYYLSSRASPAALVERLNGGDVKQPNLAQISAIGTAMAQMHLAGQNYDQQRPNCRGADWWKDALQRLDDKLAADDSTLIADEISYQENIDRSTLPNGVIHADLFHDNALFDGDQLAGIIDFYFACNDVFLYDIAVTLNDWCNDEDGHLNSEKATAYLQGLPSRSSIDRTRTGRVLRHASRWRPTLLAVPPNRLALPARRRDDSQQRPQSVQKHTATAHCRRGRAAKARRLSFILFCGTLQTTTQNHIRRTT